MVQYSDYAVQYYAFFTIDFFKVDIWIITLLRWWRYLIDVESPSFLKHAQQKVIDCRRWLLLCWHSQGHACVLVNHKPEQIKYLIDRFWVSLTLLKHQAAHFNDLRNHVSISIDSEQVVVEEVTHIFDAAHFDAQILVATLVGSKHSHDSLC